MTDQTLANTRATRNVDLPTPLKRGETEIASLLLRKPHAGEMRGIKLADLLQSDVTAILTLLPRISEPPLSQIEVDKLEPENLVALAGELVGFFMTEADRQMLTETSRS